MYQDAGPQPGGAETKPPGAEEPKEKKDEKVVDAEYEVLDDDKSS